MPDMFEAIPMEKWGKDHWSLLLYVECRCVDNKGVLDNRHMRTNVRRHRMLVGATHGVIGGLAQWKPEYTTRLVGHLQKDGILNWAPDGHDDWDCLQDLMDAGLVKNIRERRSKNKLLRRADFDFFGGNEVVVKLTPLGNKYAAKLREHKANKEASCFNFATQKIWKQVEA